MESTNRRLPILWITAAALIAAVGAAYLLRDRLFGSDSRLDDWIGRQLIGLVNTYVVPDISFDELNYVPPATVELRDVAFTAPDGTRVLEIARFSLALTEPPRLGEPIVIEEVVIDGGSIHLLRDRQTGGLRGLVPLVKAGFKVPFAPKGDPDKRFRLSDVLKIRRIQIRDMAVSYDSGAGRPPMVLDGLSADLTVEPDERAAEPGWYGLACSVKRGAILSLGLAGRLNLDTFLAELSEANLTATLSPKTINNLPPRLQDFLQRHDASGRLTVSLSGRLPWPDWRDAAATVRIELAEFEFAVGDYRLPIDRLQGEVRLGARRIELAALEAELLAGSFTVKAAGSAGDESSPGQVAWEVVQLDLAKLIRSRAADAAGDAPRLAGKLSASGSARMNLTDLPDSLNGSGTAEVREGRLLWIPLLSRLRETLRLDRLAAGLGKLNHRADAKFEFTRAGLRLTESHLVTPLLAARAEGLIGYDGTLDLRVNAGAVERFQALLGKLGEALGKLTDKLGAYHVTGTLRDPKIGVTILDGGP